MTNSKLAQRIVTMLLADGWVCDERHYDGNLRKDLGEAIHAILEEANSGVEETST
ncbi:MAG: hypothetical protein IMZ62_12730 [Chloroflexi bacterium]|nr:hypothetical protein [Chloroflexota bacterium]MBE3117516.1 hypothetical protein [Candidatus Atribacteria bacterium]